MKTAQMSVEYVDHMGSDLAVVDAARVSFNKQSAFEADENGTLFLKEGDVKLINYLAKHNHWTPFGHCTLKIRVKAPIFVARQLVKHQVGLVWNEVSRRYVDDEPEFWFPDEWRSRPDGSIKQGSGSVVIPEENLSIWMERPEGHTGLSPREVVAMAAYMYDYMIEAGVAPEQARMILPLNSMTEWIWTGSLMAFARVCKLRLDPHAQAETRKIAEYIDAIAAKHFPHSWEALLHSGD